MRRATIFRALPPLSPMEQSITLNLPYDLTDDEWDKVIDVFSSLDGWLPATDEPTWYGSPGEPRHVAASMEPGGLVLQGRLEPGLWTGWVSVLCARLSLALGREIRDAEM